MGLASLINNTDTAKRYRQAKADGNTGWSSEPSNSEKMNKAKADGNTSWATFFKELAGSSSSGGDGGDDGTPKKDKLSPAFMQYQEQLFAKLDNISNLLVELLTPQASVISPDNNGVPLGQDGEPEKVAANDNSLGDMKWWKKILDIIVDVAKKFVDIVKKLASMVIQGAAKVVEWVGKIWKKLLKTFPIIGEVIEKIKKVFGIVVEFVKSLGVKIMNIARKVGTAIVEMFIKIGKRFMSLVEPIISFITKIAAAVSKFINKVFGVVKAAKAALGLGAKAAVVGSKIAVGAATAIPAVIAKVVPGRVAGLIGKSIPGIGAAIGLGFAAWKLIQGDYVGAGLEAVSGVGGPITAIPATIAGIARDVYTEVYKIEPEKEAASILGERMSSILDSVKTAVWEAWDKLVGNDPEAKKAATGNPEKSSDKSTTETEPTDASPTGSPEPVPTQTPTAPDAGGAPESVPPKVDVPNDNVEASGPSSSVPEASPTPGSSAAPPAPPVANDNGSTVVIVNNTRTNVINHKTVIPGGNQTPGVTPPNPRYG